ncbi:MAG: hypothetical protein ABI878_04800 [Acidobacteriota bacterium]
MKKLILIYTLILLIPFAGSAQGTSFNFQGRMNDGTSPANGVYDVQFRLYDAIVGGNQIGTIALRPNTVLVNGVFSVTLDFGATAFNTPNSIFIEIGVKPNASPNAFTILGPRQQLTVVPFAVHAANADNAVHAQDAVNSVNATNANFATNAATATNALSLGGAAASEYARLNVTNPGNLQASGDLLLISPLGAGGNLSMTGNLDLTGRTSSFGTGGNLTMVGNARQNAAANGLVKAMVHVDRNGSIVHCYSGFSDAVSNCGITVTVPITGVYRLDFGLPISTRFVSITPEYATTCNVNPIACRNAGANFRFFGTNAVEVFTFDADNREDTTPASFMLIVY